MFYDERLCELMFLKLYMSVEPDICLLRRITRDINERGRSIENISVQYLSTVKPMYDKHIRNYIELADVIVAHGDATRASWIFWPAMCATNSGFAGVEE